MNIYTYMCICVSNTYSYVCTHVQDNGMRGPRGQRGANSGRDTGINETGDITHSCVFICVTLLIHVCLYVWCEFICVISFICMSLYVWYDSFVCVTWLIHIGDMNHSYVWHDPFIRVTWLIWRELRERHLDKWNRWHDSSICVIKIISMRDMTHSCVWYDIFICVRCRIWRELRERHWDNWNSWLYSFICVTWLIDMCDVTHWYVWHNSWSTNSKRVIGTGERHDSFMYVAWLFIFDIARSNVWHDSSMCYVTREICERRAK